MMHMTQSLQHSSCMVHKCTHTNTEYTLSSWKLTHLVRARGLMRPSVLQYLGWAEITFHLNLPTRIFPILGLQDYPWGIAPVLHSLLQLHQAAVNVVHIFLGDLCVDVCVCLCRWREMSMDKNTD